MKEKVVEQDGTSTCSSEEETHHQLGEGMKNPRSEERYPILKQAFQTKATWTWKRLAESELELQDLQISEFGPSEPDLDRDIKELVRGKLRLAWRRANRLDTEADVLDFTPLQRTLASALFKQKDLYYTNSAWKNRDEYRRLLCLHSLNEIQGQRARILRNNERLAASPETELCDQGFTRARVLILLPFRNSALHFINHLAALWTVSGGQVDNKKRLLDEYGPSEEDQEADARRRANHQPEDFIKTFEGNTEDCFRIGIKCTRKTLKLFCDFYASDIIIASPLGLRMAIDGQSETKKIHIIGSKRTKKKRVVKKGDYDFLSSIQILIIDQAEVILMQNWEHLAHILEYLNKIPKKTHDCDFSRIQNIFLDGWAANTRQNIIFSEFLFPELNALTKSLFNCFGAIRYQPSFYNGVNKRLLKDLKPALHMIAAESLVQVPQMRLQYFVNQVFAKFKQAANHVCIFIPSYLDFVQIREYFRNEGLSYSILSEYCTRAEISTARTRFFSGQDRFLLVTERFHFFKRYRIRGIRRLVWYALPEHAEYFEQWMSFLEPSAKNTVEIIISPFDVMRVERVFGSKRTQELFY